MTAVHGFASQKFRKMHEFRLSVLFALLLVSSATAAYTEVFEKIGPAASSAYGFSIEVDGSHAVIGS